jgi:GT2 family glycosyltransferase
MHTSIIIPNYNGEKFLQNCIASIYNQTHTNFELIIVDNASDDLSCDFIEANYEQYNQIKLIKLPQNYGFSRAVNEGIKVAQGEYVVLLNNDTEATPSWLSNLVKCIESDEKIFSCSSKMIRYNSRDKIDDAGDEYTILGWAYKRGDGLDRNKYANDSEIFSSCAGAAIYRKKVFDEIGYFDEDFFAYMEDVDICYRSKISGYKNVYCSEAIVYHVGSATSGSKYNSFKVRLAARNNIYVIVKNMPVFQLFINLPFLLIGFIIKALFFLKLGYGREYMSGFAEGIKNALNMAKKRLKTKSSINYLLIEVELIINAIKYLFSKIKNKHFVI